MPRSHMLVESYDLKLDIDFAKAFVKGLVTLAVRRAERPLLLDAVDMTVLGVEANGRPVPFTHRQKAGVLVVRKVPLTARLAIRYEKQIPDDVIFGFYKARYGSGYILATDLEPAEARRVLPCRDHPAFKSVFRVQVTTDQGKTVISNSPVKSVKELVGGRRRFTFTPTPRMSTYLLFIGVGDFQETRGKAGPIDVLVASRPKEDGLRRLPLEFTAGSLSFYEKYYGVRYPLKKLHLVGLPEYHTGAMENWGAITSREAYALLDESSSIYERRHAAEVIAHEVAHQWFGDLVTMKWWDDLWLNESFATFMSHHAIQRLYPSWDTWDEFLRTSLVPSLNSDALTDTHPIQVKVRTPEEASQVFDAISYGKGASVLRMMEAYIGEEPFRKGVSAYLKKFRFSNAKGEDLWKSIEKASGKPVSKIMGSWVKKRGFPLVEATVGDGKLTLEQRRFSLSGGEASEVWPIPLTMEVNGKARELLFDRRKAEVPLGRVSSFKANLGETGFYSVLYDVGTYDRLAERFHSLPTADKWGLLGDLFLFLQSGLVDPALYFRFVSLCKEERSYLILRGLTDHLLSLHSIADEFPRVKEPMTEFVLHHSRRLGSSPRAGEPEDERMLRGDFLSMAARLDGESAAALAAEFPKYGDLDPNVRAAVARGYAIAKGDEAYGPLEKMVRTLDSETDRGKVYSALCSFKEPELVRRTLELSVSGEVSRSDSGYTIGAASFNPYARQEVWHWIRDRFERLWEIYGGSQQILLYFERAVPRCAVDSEEELRAFLTPAMARRGGNVFKRTLEQLRVNSDLKKRLAGY